MRRVSHNVRRTTLWIFLIIMPVGVEVDPENPNELTVSAHGGFGQFASVIRDCDGNPLASETSNFVDIAGSVQVSHRSGSGLFSVLGIRGGHLYSDANIPRSNYEGNSGGNTWYDSYKIPIIFSYFNPYVAVESRNFGIGTGYFSYGTQYHYYLSNIPISGHLRFGNYNKINFQVSLNENLPLVSGGGYFKLGMGYRVGSRGRMFTGLSAGFYDGPGFVQQVFLPLSNQFDLDLVVRLGSTEGHFETGVALGLRYHFPFGSAETPFGETSDQQIKLKPSA